MATTPPAPHRTFHTRLPVLLIMAAIAKHRRLSIQVLDIESIVDIGALGLYKERKEICGACTSPLRVLLFAGPELPDVELGQVSELTLDKAN